ncbi:hypothetical protein LCGC14_2475440, partial [marine sediment metagenome]
VEVDWDEAIRVAAENLAAWRGNGFGIIGSAQDTLEENYSLQKFTRAVMNSNNIDLISSFPDPRLQEEIASHLQPKGRLEDILKADTLLVLGTDASVSHPLVENRIRKAYNAGRKVLYANSEATRTSLFSTVEINYSKCKDYNFLFVLLAELARETISGLPAGFAKQVKESLLISGLKSCSVKKDDLQAFVKALVKSRSLCIIVDESLLRDVSGLQTIKALANIRFLKAEKSNCRIMLLGNEGNLMGAAMAGAHPYLLPGLDPVSDDKALLKWNKNWDVKLSDVRGLPCNEMLSNIGRDGISALMIAGDVPVSGNLGKASLKKLKFMVQLNMFSTELTDHANVFLPVTGFLENDGHFLTLDGKIQRLHRAVPPQGKSRSVSEIISLLAGAMKADGFSTGRAGAVWKEIGSSIKIPVPQNGSPKPRFELMKPPDSRNAGSGKKSGSGKNHQDHYRYRGNRLSDLVTDLQALLESGMKEKV